MKPLLATLAISLGAFAQSPQPQQPSKSEQQTLVELYKKQLAAQKATREYVDTLQQHYKAAPTCQLVFNTYDQTDMLRWSCPAPAPPAAPTPPAAPAK